MKLVTVFSLTSPLGVVPREIETIYPARNYDIPVTGSWSHEETEITSNILQKMLAALPEHIGVIVHVSEGYRQIIQHIQNQRKLTTTWVGSKPTSGEALQSLTESIREFFVDKEFFVEREKKGVINAKKVVNALLRYNHGKHVHLDLESIKLVGRPPRPIQVQKNSTHWLTWDSIHGNVRLSPIAAKMICKESENWVIADTIELKGSSLFAVGVLDASDKISPGDEVIIFNSNRSAVIGVGEAKICGKTMLRISSGPVAKIRKKANFPLEV
ncbi:MAG: DUF5591 domain-containing protein [Candidatus Kariarchaeaceae archaeon]|jgi:archaeosine synthase